ncbi:MAG: DUF2958 domain-containing protein [Proteobacteria bacterium]|nr:DUF2958 domain-containing protein [Pseudomonadota bacterium]MBU1542455.1 DUF2958 domain-containing protein [Pseudomonadota bacterium]MBU2431101.1 DUF2958 domain-containing protein [Pseudomonadota bacterium]
MFNKPTQKQLAGIPKLYASETIPMKDKPVCLHFSFPGGSDWWVFEYNGNDTFFGYVILRNDFQMSEAGYFSLSELADIRIHDYLEVEFDLQWNIRPASQVERICIARGWPMPKTSAGIEIECPNCKKTILSDSVNSKIQCSECKIIVLERHLNPNFQGGLFHGLYS